MLTDYAGKIGRPGMVVKLHHPVTVEPVGGSHRTCLADDGNRKPDTPKQKMMLGSPAGGAAMLMQLRDEGVVGIGEGVETSLGTRNSCGGGLGKMLQQTENCR